MAVVIDLYSRKVAGWALADHMHTSLVTAAFGREISSVPPVAGAMPHSDRGCQYISAKTRRDLEPLGFAQSMSAKGRCNANAKSESFFATIRREAFPEGCSFDTKAGACRAISDYMEAFYNRRRRQSCLGNISPEEYLNRHYQNQKSALNKP